MELDIYSLGCLVFGAAYLVIQGLLLGYWPRCRAVPQTSRSPQPISIIIAAHNEFANLQRFLPKVLAQQYAPFEVVLVLDRCSDGSLDFVRNLQKKHPHLQVVVVHSTPEGWSPKKWALQQGIQQARYAWLAFTDADCLVSPKWVSLINLHIDPGVELILGIGKYLRYPGLLNRFIRFETFYTYFQYVGFAHLGLPYMGVGRNMAYSKSFFQRAGGMENIKKTLSGDDDLLVNLHANPRTTRTMVHPDSYTYSLPKRNWKTYTKQKFRHVSASNSYQIRSKLVLGAFHLSHSLFYVFFFVSLGLGTAGIPQIIIFTGRMLLSLILYHLLNKHFREEGFGLHYLVLDMFYFIYNLLLVPVGLTKKPEWH